MREKRWEERVPKATRKTLILYDLGTLQWPSKSRQGRSNCGLPKALWKPLPCSTENGLHGAAAVQQRACDYTSWVLVAFEVRLPGVYHRGQTYFTIKFF